MVLNPIITMLQDYFYLRQRVPLLIYLYYSKFKDENEPGVEWIIELTTLLVGITTIFMVIAFMNNIPLPTLIHIDWNYSGILTWGIFFLVYYYTGLRAHMNKLTAFTLSMLATVGGGWLYEIPFFHPIKMFISYNTIFYINSQIICLLLLVYELHKMGLKMDKKIYLGALLYLAFSGVLLINYRLMARALGGLYIWSYRLPTCILLLSLLSGVNGK